MSDAKVYELLMEHSIHRPLEDWNTNMVEQVAKILSSLEKMGENQLKAAYTAGLRDGYAQALIDVEKANG